MEKNIMKGEVYLDPLENNKVEVKRLKLDKLIENAESAQNEFSSLLFTHNTNILGFLKILKSGAILGKCNNESKGAQFRYGIDSQYGEIKFIMKRNSYLISKLYGNSNNIVTGCAVNKYGAYFVDDPYYTKLPDLTKELTEEKLDDELLKEAKNYDFRMHKYNNNSNKNSFTNGSKCNNDYMPTWCNIQLHVSEDVSLRHVDYILVPNFVFSSEFQDIIKNNKDFSDILGNKTLKEFIKYYGTTRIIDGNLNYSHNKIIDVKSKSDHNNYYSFIGKGKISYLDGIEAIKDDPNLTYRIPNFLMGSY